MASVVWLPEALEDIARLYDFLAEKSPDAARRAALGIKAVAEKLAKFPAMGSPMNDGKHRQVFLSFGTGAYVVRYRLNQKRRRSCHSGVAFAGIQAVMLPRLSHVTKAINQ